MKIATQITPSTLATTLELVRAELRAQGESVTAELLATLAAHSAQETGRWTAMRNYNHGFIKASARWKGGGDHFSYLGADYRAHATAAEGAANFVQLLTGPRYRHALDAAREGRPGAYVDAIKAAGYFEAPLAPYRAGVESMTREFLPTAEQYAEPFAGPPSTAASVSDTTVLAALAVLGIVLAARQLHRGLASAWP